ncbi:hypothetical protein ABE29_06365 [Cytobacillus firmus]|uniref:hypothetical protein n=1 Tax=Cytobacillus firmus TaxID=1399 RepID=UPI00077C9BF1|nr:hypothetical protein [Cytobacillus firmus]MBG9542459.1 hypothetical protein [Cytobacillus firmus]MBG9546950.1 hypothetical protein [Cytobacillus firmus]MBG9552156.1 hypothetical protein [Cytobacillus firmus]MBG9557549.1 hypothetical protein [Cytobacillus firmus]MBG9575194.1 hypothetical protein [Cytobacillus firmus]
MKKALSLGLAATLFMSSGSAYAAGSSKSETIKSIVEINNDTTEVSIQDETAVIKDNSVFFNIDGVEVEFVGGAEEYNDNPEYLEESVIQAKDLVESKLDSQNENIITPFVVPDQGSGGRWGGIYKNYFEINAYDSIKYSISAAVAATVTTAGVILSKDATTSGIVGAFAGAAATAVADTSKPDWTSTYYVSDYSAYYKRTIYKQVTNIYRNSGRTDLASIKVSQPLDKVSVNGKQTFRAAR